MIVRILVEGGVDIHQPFGGPAFQHQDEPAPGLRQFVRLAENQRLVEIQQGLVELANRHIGQAAIGECQRILRIEADGMIVVGESFLCLSLIRLDKGSPAIGRGVIRVQRDRTLEVGHGQIELQQARQRCAAYGQ